MSYLALHPANLTVLWFPAGIAIIAVLSFGYKSLPFVFLASFLSNWDGLHQNAKNIEEIHILWAITNSAIIDTIQPLIAYRFWKKFIRSNLTSVSDLIYFIILISFLPCLGSALGLGLNLYTFSYFEGISLLETLKTLGVLFLGDAMGIFITVPLYYHWMRPGFSGSKFGFLILISIQFLFLIFIVPYFPFFYFFSFLVLTMLGYFNRLKGISFGILQLYVVSIFLTNHKLGPFVYENDSESYLFLVSFLIPFSFLSEFLTILYFRLENYQFELEKKVFESTKLLRKQIFEKNTAIEALNLSERKLNESNKTKDKFFSIIAHDLKSPLGSYNQLIRMVIEDFGKYTDFEIQEILNRIHESSERLYQLLDYLLDWARTQSQSMPFSKESFDLYKLVSRVYLDHQEKLRNKQIQFKLTAANPSIVNADEAMIHTVVRNLVSNAVKFTSVGGTIEVLIYKNDEGTFLECIDTGVGIRRDNLEKLFRIDAQLTSIGLEGEKGTGLGLILCKEFIGMHGGEIWAESEIGLGTKITFRIP